jgi:hypothetical protein
MVVEAFEYSGNQEAELLAFDIAQRWTRTNYKAYVEHNKTMFEKVRKKETHPLEHLFSFSNSISSDIELMKSFHFSTTSPA